MGMKKLILVRHGKSSWEYNVSDKDRTLLERGIKDAHLVANELKSQKKDINAVFSSPANRALHTCLIFLRELNFPFHKFSVVSELYDFSGQAVIDFVNGLDNELNTVMIFGHNHALTAIANYWGDNRIENVPTAGLVELSFTVSKWAEIVGGTTANIIFPKNLRE